AVYTTFSLDRLSSTRWSVEQVTRRHFTTGYFESTRIENAIIGPIIGSEGKMYLYGSNIKLELEHVMTISEELAKTTWEVSASQTEIVSIFENTMFKFDVGAGSAVHDSSSFTRELKRKQKYCSYDKHGGDAATITPIVSSTPFDSPIISTGSITASESAADHSSTTLATRPTRSTLAAAATTTTNSQLKDAAAQTIVFAVGGACG
ncbi:hypothetical protein PENTCL1PPCAC_1073, partial [Pristionchus entomophagus]